ncbi:mechanosensitive ion channel family protein [Niallia circulans]|jgi:moderate conductance mechanosensitive channel|uniref:Mechanosensitive ion channel protein MscS n=1 Tax=Niallia circulans TaxID=1397 RepID=A0A0J1KTT1_NIACI|nr:mechanosensitive ion channel family protein [Niallia circulans]KLV20095.1 mechanosensitive ion channel protein MscS [Niallia circulans]MCM2981084.1 mechanosensitive ion channel family protein [Niallia circulans]MDR4316619.1 mechanosensitive ion channel family protein [Niallia circulans]MED3840388.1 mechanosensitive ion channel family protein [Niallia circulans]MED4242076.1 mechanosensitive ion channel family protein [Niallia circulans]
MDKNIKEGIDSLMNENLWRDVGVGALKLVLIFLISGIIIRIGKAAVRNIFKVRTHSALRVSERREATLIKLLENTITYVVYFIAIMMALSVFHIDVKALLAGAGIVGLAIGFGAQSLVKDIITGFFIIFEDQFSVGDQVRIGTYEGVVEEIGLRTTKIKGFTGEVNIIPNGSIVDVTNFSINNSKAIVDVSIAYQGDINRAEKVILELIEKLPEQYEDIVGVPELLGVQNIQAAEVTIRVVAETLPTKHHAIARILRKEIKNVLDENGIESPVPKLVMYSQPQ